MSKCDVDCAAIYVKLNYSILTQGNDNFDPSSNN